MSDTTSKEFRKALASAIKYHAESNGLNGVSASKIVGIANSRMSQIIRGDVDKISSDAMIEILGKFGYRFSSVIGSVDGHEFMLTLSEKGEGLPEIEVPVNPVEVLRPIVEGYAEAVGLEVDNDAIDEAAAYAEQEVDHDADRVIADA